MYYSENLKSMPYAQAIVKHDDGKLILQSYFTDVCTVTKKGWLTVSGLYSMTTRRHISAFCRDFLFESGVTYQLCKKLYEENLKYNLKTGELKKNR